MKFYLSSKIAVFEFLPSRIRRKRALQIGALGFNKKTTSEGSSISNAPEQFAGSSDNL